MSTELIAKARALRAAATGGKWKVWGYDNGNPKISSAPGDGRMESIAVVISFDRREENQTFIAGAAELLPALADLAESEGKRADEAEHVVDRWMATAHELKARLDTAIENCSVARAEVADQKRTLQDVAQELTKAGIAAHVNLPGLTIAYGLCDRVEQLAGQRDAAQAELARLKGQKP